MRIISKFRDYYDGGAMYGVNKTKIYIRDRIILKPDNIEGLSAYDYLGFCGEIYILKNYTEKYGTVWHKGPKNSILWEEDASKFKLKWDNYEVMSKEKIWRPFHDIDYYKNKIKDLNLFLKYKVPIFYIGQDGNSHNNKQFILNPKLSDYYFQQFYDIFFHLITAYSESDLCDSLT